MFPKFMRVNQYNENYVIKLFLCEWICEWIFYDYAKFELRIEEMFRFFLNINAKFITSKLLLSAVFETIIYLPVNV